MNSLQAAVKANCIELGVKTADIAKVLEMSEGNVRKIIREETISYKHLVTLSNYLHFSDEQKSELFKEVRK